MVRLKPIALAVLHDLLAAGAFSVLTATVERPVAALAVVPAHDVVEEPLTEANQTGHINLTRVRFIGRCCSISTHIILLIWCYCRSAYALFVIQFFMEH